MAPEIVVGEDAGAFTDVYLLGATLHAVLTKQPRHQGDDLLALAGQAEEPTQQLEPLGCTAGQHEMGVRPLLRRLTATAFSSSPVPRARVTTWRRGWTSASWAVISPAKARASSISAAT